MINNRLRSHTAKNLSSGWKYFRRNREIRKKTCDFSRYRSFLTAFLPYQTPIFRRYFRSPKNLYRSEFGFSSDRYYNETVAGGGGRCQIYILNKCVFQPPSQYSKISVIFFRFFSSSASSINPKYMTWDMTWGGTPTPLWLFTTWTFINSESIKVFAHCSSILYC